MRRWKTFLSLAVTLFLGSTAAHALEFDGVIEPHVLVKVGSGVAGIIESVDVERGDLVKKGQVVARLQSGVEKAAMEVARARAETEATVRAKQTQLDFTARKQKRHEQLYKKEAVALSQMDETETGRAMAEMDLKEAMENKRLAELEFRRTSEVVKRLTIHSPIEGVVVERFLSPGEYVEDQPILKLAQINPLNVEVIVPVARFPSIMVGMRAQVLPEEPVGGRYTAQVKIIDRVIDAASGTFGVRLELPNPEHRLPAGLKCKVIFPDP
jgi:RND family efflux transporter MFP subunit